MLLYFITAIALLSLSSCSKKLSFSSSSVVPAASGSIKLKNDENKNKTIDVNVRNLAPASQLTPPKKIYVFWMVTENNEARNLGQLRSETSFLSKKLKASLKTTTSFKPIYFFITAEDEGNVKYPGLIVLTTK